uniref:Nitronate monooxygenase domain-containing protein n=1 Tax=Alexandrium andersonii TaxID=327968 RepID=A0A7S2I8G9_9DINO|mmetsp:Transcript_79667/g.178199  ORF Transcript_79667/g.178199 Transcript_79667/m.178199 type:complete len:374 (+) Transcript_79667:69-1190(+)
MIRTPLTEMFGIKHPILLAGMGAVSDGELAAAVTNAGGMGCMGGATMSVKALKMNIDELKKNLVDKSGPFGVDLLIPQVGGNARKTNKDYTGGHLPELIDVIIEGGAKLFICAVGVPPVWVVEKLHSAGVLVMNMVGHVKHVEKALKTGVDLICAQGGEGGGHTGEIATSILIPKVVDACRGKTSPLTGGPVHVVAAGGIFDGRGLASALSVGCAGVWVGTRFIASEEAGAGPVHKQRVVKSGYEDTVTTTIYTGRPMRVFKTPYVLDWEENRRKEMLQVQEMGFPAFVVDVDELEPGASVGVLQQAETLTQEEKKQGVQLSRKEVRERGVYLTGQCAGAIGDIKPAKEIVEEMVVQAAEQLKVASSLLNSRL